MNAEPVGVLHMHELMTQEVENAWLPLAAAWHPRDRKCEPSQERVRRTSSVLKEAA